MEFEAIQNESILKAVESDLDSFDAMRLERSKALLQSDLWTVERRLDDRPGDAQLIADRDRLKAAIGRIDKRLKQA